MNKIKIAQYVFRPLSYTYTSVLSKSLSYKNACTSSTTAFVHAARPTFAIVPVGADSPFGHPHAEVLARWRDAGARVLTTGRHGTITVSTDGEDLRLETYVP